jgi:hypothetical protein
MSYDDALVLENVTEKIVTHDEKGRITGIREARWIPEPVPDAAVLEAAAVAAVGKILNGLVSAEAAATQYDAPLGVTITCPWGRRDTQQALGDLVKKRLDVSSTYAALVRGKWPSLNISVTHGSSPAPAAPAASAVASQRTVTPRRAGFV